MRLIFAHTNGNTPRSENSTAERYLRSSKNKEGTHKLLKFEE